MTSRPAARARTLLLALALLAACSEPRTPRDGAAGKAAAEAPAPRATEPAGAVVRHGDTLTFSYAWPADAGPPAFFRKEAAALEQQARADAARDKADAARHGYPFRPHDFAKSWTLEGSGGPLVSLSATIDAYTGGAHGMRVFDAQLFDRRLNGPIPVAVLFTNAAATMQALQPGFCRALDAERSRRRDAPVARGDAFDTGCPDLSRYRIVPAGTARFDRLRVLLPPYEAGPYVEGAYEITLPMTPALAAAIAPQYRDAFRPSAPAGSP